MESASDRLNRPAKQDTKRLLFPKKIVYFSGKEVRGWRASLHGLQDGLWGGLRGGLRGGSCVGLQATLFAEQVRHIHTHGGSCARNSRAGEGKNRLKWLSRTWAEARTRRMDHFPSLWPRTHGQAEEKRRTTKFFCGPSDWLFTSATPILAMHSEQGLWREQRFSKDSSEQTRKKHTQKKSSFTKPCLCTSPSIDWKSSFGSERFNGLSLICTDFSRQVGVWYVEPYMSCENNCGLRAAATLCHHRTKTEPTLYRAALTWSGLGHFRQNDKKKTKRGLNMQKCGHTWHKALQIARMAHFEHKSAH